MTLRREVFQALRAEGYRGKAGVCKMPVAGADGFAFVVDTGPPGKRPDISPQVGLRHEEVADLWYDLLGLPRYEYSATVSANIGYLLEDAYRTWEPPTTAEEVVGLIHAALDRLRPYASLDRVAAAFDAFPGTKLNPNTNYVRVLVAAVRGDPAVEQELAAAEQAYCAKGGGPCDQFREFERNLRGRFGLA